MDAAIIVKTQPELRCQNRYKRFSESHCLLTISVGQSAHEFLKFSATINLINQQFKECSICVGDTLQRFTLAMEQTLPPEALFDEAKKFGDEWMERNFSRYSLLNIPHQIIRWNTYLSHPKFEEIKANILALYDRDLACQKAFKLTIDTFMSRYLSRHQGRPPIFLETARQYCFQYLVEESAAMCLWAEKNYDYEVYPSRRNGAMEFIYQRFIVPSQPHVLTSVFIKSINFMY